MNRKIKAIGQICILIIFTHATFAQTIKGINASGTPSLMTFDTFSGAVAKSKTNATVNGKMGVSLAPEEVLKKYLNPKPDNEFRLTKRFNDELGYEHYNYQQFYRGIKVEFSNYKVHYKQGQ